MLKRFICLLLVSSVALAADGTVYDFVTSSQNLTGSAPTLSTEGLSLNKFGNAARAYRVTLSANSGATLSGAGSLLCYHYGAVTTRWTRCGTAFDFTSIPSGGRDTVFADVMVGVGSGRIQYVPSGVTVSAGTTVDVTIAAQYGGSR